MLKGFRRYFNSAMLLCVLSVFSCSGLLASDGDPENFRIEVTGSVWTVNPSGQLQISGTSFDLRRQLDVEQNQPTFYGKLVVKPGRRHRIVVEGTPFRLNGNTVVNETVQFRGRQFNVQQTLRGTAALNYFFAGYQYDVISRPMGHFGFSVGGAYLNASGDVRAVETGIVLSTSQNVGLPLAGAEFRIFPIPHHPIIEINGDVRGMAFGDYGHYLQGGGSGGINLGHFAIEAGYRAVNADLHNTNGTPSGIFAHLHGPIYSLVFRY